jgi:hypothetical protein
MGWSDKAFVLYYSHATKRSAEEAGRSLKYLLEKNNSVRRSNELAWRIRGAIVNA